MDEVSLRFYPLLSHRVTFILSYRLSNKLVLFTLRILKKTLLGSLLRTLTVGGRVTSQKQLNVVHEYNMNRISADDSPDNRNPGDSSHSEETETKLSLFMSIAVSRN